MPGGRYTQSDSARGDAVCSPPLLQPLVNFKAIIISLADLGFFSGVDFGNPSERSERVLSRSGLAGE